MTLPGRVYFSGLSRTDSTTYELHHSFVLVLSANGTQDSDRPPVEQYKPKLYALRT
jgi:hypothetical protein